MDLTVFIAVTAAAVVLQTIILFVMCVAVFKSKNRVEAIASEVRTKVLPAAETVQSMLTELRPKIENTAANVSETTGMIRAQMVRIDATLNDVVDRSRLQIIRADDMVSKTLDRVEETAEAVHNGLAAPVRHLNGIIHGVGVAIGHLASARRRNHDVNVPQDEMFI
jgi:hypothetical protein